MLSEDAIRRPLHTSRSVPLEVPNPHGPLGLEMLAAAVAAHRQAIETLPKRSAYAGP